MINNKFEVYKIKREIKKSGEQFKIYQKRVNDFGSPYGDDEFVCFLNGIYHEENSHISVTTGEVMQTRTKKIPNILCLYSDISDLKTGMLLYINKRKYKITGIVNVQEWNLIADVSLELVDNVVYV